MSLVWFTVQREFSDELVMLFTHTTVLGNTTNQIGSYKAAVTAFPKNCLKLFNSCK